MQAGFNLQLIRLSDSRRWRGVIKSFATNDRDQICVDGPRNRLFDLPGNRAGGPNVICGDDTLELLVDTSQQCSGTPLRVMVDEVIPKFELL